jgi:hypothetical protein
MEFPVHYISIFSTIVTFAFTASVFNRYQHKRGTHLLFWGIGLLFYGLGTLTEVILSFTFNELALKTWYLTGAMLTAAWLGQGTVFLLVRKRGVARALAAVLVLASLASLFLVMAAPLTPAAASYDVSQPVSAQYKEILTRSAPVVILTILLNIYGTLGLVGGALYSSFLFWRKKVLVNRMLGNILIAFGALLPASAGSLLKAGLVDWLYISEFLGVVIMYLGFLQATSGRTVEQKPAPGAAD